MKEIKLMNLTLKNFKGIEDFALELNGASAQIYGSNDVGKTTVYDAFLWLLFNKNSLNETKFTIKKFDDEGVATSNLEHEVEATLLVNGTPVTLKKVLFEDWAQKRNSLEMTFKGNTNRYFIDEVPKKEKEYQAFVKSLIEEETFKLLTSPTHFNLHLKPDERRKTLFDIVGDPTDEEIISTDKTLEELSGILKGKKVEEHKLIIAGKKKAINEEIKSIPIRINEITKLLPKGNIDVPSIEIEIAVVEKELDKHATQINNIKNGTAVVSKQQELQQVELDLKTIQNESESESIEQAAKLNAKIQEEQSNVAILKRKKEDAEHQVKRNQSDIETIDAELERLREDFDARYESAHTHDSEDECPTCKQSLPVEDVKTAKEKASAAFNLNKSTELERIRALGKSKAAKKTELVEYNKKQTTAIAGIQSQISEKEEAVSKLTTEVETLRTGIVEARQSKRYTDKVQERIDIEKSIVTLQENAQSAVADIEKEVAELRAKRTEHNAQIAQQAQTVASKERITELEAQQKKLAEEFEQLRKETFLVERFTGLKTELLDEKIQSEFKFARFKLSDKQNDGTLTDTCETMYKGVPFGDGLNTAARLNVGLDICETLQNHYGVKVPVWIDNRETVVDVLEIDTQVISLVVSGQDKQLRIEKQAVEEDGAA